jgi:thioredoxin 1
MSDIGCQISDVGCQICMLTGKSDIRHLTSDIDCGIRFEITTPMATIQMTLADFKEKVFDFEKEEEWKYAGELPAIIDFYADWCGPCKAIAPVLEELSKKYEGRLLIYKIDTDKENELSSIFGIQSIPTLLFIPMQGSPMLQKGAVPKNTLVEVIEDKLLATEEI